MKYASEKGCYKSVIIYFKLYIYIIDFLKIKFF